MVPKDLQHADYRIRKLVGTLGLLLPFMVYFAQGEFLASISHYYYSTLPSLIFIIVLSAFGLFLLSYKGYKIDTSTETISDDWLTNIGGLAALIVVFVPTSCANSTSERIDLLCSQGLFPLFGHNDATSNSIHLVAAGVFILCMGWMSSKKFTRNPNDKHNPLYRLCGNLVFISVALIVFFIVLENLGVNFPLRDYYVFIFETTAVIPFGISWLVKGKAIDNVKDFGKRMLE